MKPIDIGSRDGFQVIRMSWTKEVPGFQRESFDLVRAAIQAADQSAEIFSTVILGTPSCFCLGTDALTFTDAAGISELAASVEQFFKQLIQARKPLIAAVDGDAVGLGMTMLLHFDAIFATPSSTFRAPFAEWGLVPEAASSMLLPELLGYRKAFDIFCLGGALSADAALASGFLTAVEPSDKVETAAFNAARRIAKLPPKAIVATRTMMRAGSLRLERRANMETSFRELLRDGATQRRLRVMGRAARVAIAG